MEAHQLVALFAVAQEQAELASERAEWADPLQAVRFAAVQQEQAPLQQGALSAVAQQQAKQVQQEAAQSVVVPQQQEEARFQAAAPSAAVRKEEVYPQRQPVALFVVVQQQAELLVSAQLAQVQLKSRRASEGREHRVSEGPEQNGRGDGGNEIEYLAAHGISSYRRPSRSAIPSQ
jgi:hypothetical protein